MASPAADLAPSLTSRPVHMDEAQAVLDLSRRCEEVDVGEALLEIEDIVSDWQQPSFHLESHSLGVFDGTELVAYAQVAHGRRADGYVHPDHRGEGIGSALLRWTWEVARAAGGSRVGQPVPQDSSAERLLLAHGYQRLWTSWLLEFPPHTPLPKASCPPGTTIRPCRPGQEMHEAYQTVEDAFNEWPDRDPTAYADWEAAAPRRPGSEPWWLQVAMENERMVGVANLVVSDGSAFVSQFAVRRDRRGRGIGKALLSRAFGEGRRHGATRAELSTDSRTGALDLYLHLGMRGTHTFVHLAKTLDDAA